MRTERTTGDHGSNRVVADEDVKSEDAHLEDALERVAHGAVVSVPSILLKRALVLAFTAILTNGFTASAYGLFVLARRIQGLLVSLSLGFRAGLSRFLPTADVPVERDLVATFGSMLVVGVAVAFGAILYVAAPTIVQLANEGAQFVLFVRVFAIGLPASVWLWTVAELLRGLEEVIPLNVTLRVGFPALQLLVGVAGLLFADLIVVAVSVCLVAGITGTVAAAWLTRAHDLRPRLRGPDATILHRRYVRYTAPLFVGGFATTLQRFGFYPLIAVFLSGVVGGIFAVGVLLGMIVSLPLLGINQLMPPVAATLHEGGHGLALNRLYSATSRLVLMGVTGLAVPMVVFRDLVMAVFGPAFVAHASLLPVFVLAQVLACAAGSVGILLMMTDHQRALLVVNTIVTTILIVTTIPLTRRFGLMGVVGGYLLMLALNNGLEVAVLYGLEGLQPFTRRHAKPLIAAVPLAVVTLATRSLASSSSAAVAGTAFGLLAYAAALSWLGFDPIEVRLLGSLARRYRGAL